MVLLINGQLKISIKKCYSLKKKKKEKLKNCEEWETNKKWKNVGKVLVEIVKEVLLKYMKDCMNNQLKTKKELENKKKTDQWVPLKDLQGK